MKWSQTLIPTMKEIPDGAEIPSHILMLRAGMISQVMAGAYSYLPLGLRVLQKAVAIVREEINKTGAVELLMTALCPTSLYERTNRVEAFGNVLIKTDLPRAGKKVPVVFCPTHEEEITDIVSRYISSYRQLPITLYQIQTKFRNEERPKFGILRTSEFLMKDAYSFHTELESLNERYEKMYKAYCDIFTRCWEGARVSLTIALVATLINVMIGVLYGGISGYFGGTVDRSAASPPPVPTRRFRSKRSPNSTRPTRTQSNRSASS